MFFNNVFSHQNYFYLLSIIENVTNNHPVTQTRKLRLILDSYLFYTSTSNQSPNLVL